MPGPPLDINSNEFQKTIILISGKGGIGKSTIANALSNNSETILIPTDAFSGKYLNSNRNQGNLYADLKNNKKQELYLFVWKNIIEKIDQLNAKIFILEGFVLKDMLLYFDLQEKFKKRIPKLRIWELKRN